MGNSFSRKAHKIVKLFFFCLLFDLYAEPIPYFSVYNTTPKYGAEAKHFDYINPNAPKKGALKISIAGTFDSLNPFSVMGNSPMHIAMLCFARLFDESQDEVGISYPYAAESIEISNDKSKITFFLRKNAVFSDGSPITADDILWSFNFLVKINPMMKQYYKDIIKVEVLNPHTIRFHSKNPNNKELPLILGQIYIYHSKFFEKYANERGAITKPFPVSGPYKICTADFGRTLVFERVKNWWGEDLLTNKGLYNFNIIEGHFFKDTIVAFQAFLAKNINLWIETSPKQWHTAYDVTSVKDKKIIKKLIPTENFQATKGLVFNLRREKFQDIRVRKAISLLFNFESLNKSVFYNEYSRLNSYYGTGELAHKGELTGEELEILQPYKNKVPSEVFGSTFKNPIYTDDFIPRKTLKQILALLKEAGWELKDQKLTNKNGEIFEINFLYSNSILEKVILHLQRNLQVAGIKLNPRFVDVTTYTEMIDQFDFDMATILIPQAHFLGNEQREFFGSKSARVKGSKNLAGIENAVVDELIEKLISAKNYQSMLHYAHAIDRVLCWNYYMILDWNFSALRIAYWNQFAMPEKTAKYAIFPILTWWFKQDITNEKTSPDQNIFTKIFNKVKGWIL